MTKIDRNWRISCENGQQMNEVWQVLKDAGEPMFSDKPWYNEGNSLKVMVFNKHHWMCGDIHNITFKEFMASMKPETANTDTLLHDSVHTPLNSRRISVTSEAKKEDVQYVTNLLDYLDKPELIQHKDWGPVRALHYFPNNTEYNRVLAVFEGSETCRCSVEGFRTQRYKDDGVHLFVLKPKPKEYVTSWRRPVILENGSQAPDQYTAPTKEEFMKRYNRINGYRYGPWEEVITEVYDE